MRDTVGVAPRVGFDVGHQFPPSLSRSGASRRRQTGTGGRRRYRPLARETPLQASKRVGASRGRPRHGWPRGATAAQIQRPSTAATQIQQRNAAGGHKTPVRWYMRLPIRWCSSLGRPGRERSGVGPGSGDLRPPTSAGGHRHGAAMARAFRRGSLSAPNQSMQDGGLERRVQRGRKQHVGGSASGRSANSNSQQGRRSIAQNPMMQAIIPLQIPVTMDGDCNLLAIALPCPCYQIQTWGRSG